MSHWPNVTLGEVAAIERKIVDASAIRSGSLYVGLENIQTGGSLTEVRAVDAGELASSKFAFSSQHVLFGKLRPYLAKVARPNFSGVCSTDILPVLPGPSLDRRFLQHFLLTPRIIEVLSSRATGANLPRLSPGALAELRVPLPPVAEQRRIAEILDEADELRAKRRAALAQLDTLTQSIFLDMFGGTHEQNWEMGTIRDVGEPGTRSIRTGPFGSQLLHDEFTESGIAVLGIDNAVANEFRWGERRFISQAKYQQLSRYTVKPGDVLITIMGTCGRCAIVPDDIPIAINTKHLCCITVDRSRFEPAFLHAYFLRHPIAAGYLRKTAKGAIMAGLNIGIIEAMPIPMVPLGLQRTFTIRADAIKGVQAAQAASLAQLDELFASLQHRAFSGQL